MGIVIVNSPVRVILFSADAVRGSQVASALEAAGHAVARGEQPNLAEELLRRERPDLVVAVVAGSGDGSGWHRLGDIARTLQIPALAVIDAHGAAVERARGFDDWVDVDRFESDLAPRVRWLLGRPVVQPGPEVDPRFLALIVHDLRTPLNVIGLTIRAIGQSNPSPNPEFEEDINFLQENAKQIERMLAQLGDYCRLLESHRAASAVEFEPRRFLADLLEEKQARRDSEFKAVRLEFAPDSPSEVALDPSKARLAISHALANGMAAAGDAPVKIRSSGPAGAWTVEVVVDKAPPPTTTAVALRPHIFERLLGSPGERRGLDLAIASRISELFGGSARLDVEPGARTVVALEWPARLDPTPGSGPA